MFLVFFLLTFASSVQLVWVGLESELSVGDDDLLSTSLPSRDPGFSKQPTHHSPSLPSQNLEGPTAKPQGSNVDRTEVRAVGSGGVRVAINLKRKL